MPAPLLLLAVGVALACLGLAWHQRVLLRYGMQFVRMQLSVRWFVFRRLTVADSFAERALASPSDAAIVYEGRTMSYGSLDRLSSRVGAWGLQRGLEPRVTVAIMMESSPTFVAVWLGLAKIGVTAALINTQLRGTSLEHCLRSCEASLIIVGRECLLAFDAVRAELGPAMPVWTIDDDSADAQQVEVVSPRSPNGLALPPYEDLSAALAALPDLHRDFRALRVAAGINSSDLLFLIFTSGTTGLPKAAKIKHLRWALSAASFVNFFGITREDRIYCCLPMYHSAGGIIGLGCAWYTGGALVLRRKFSASKFFEDCVAHDVTIVQYIGQLARYLLASPPGPCDTSHRVRMALGNGLGEDVWDAFCARFRIPFVAEFYASTEGNANLINNLNIKGVIGWIPPIARLLYPVRIVRFDTVEERPVRDASGRCIECKTDEPGELLSRIDADPLRAFDGYTNARATMHKILHGVLRPHDRWFRSGDLVVQDAQGRIRFVDRVGDTFRWKGENVATTAVSATLSTWAPTRGPSIEEANVYGVFVAGNEGRAGMASLSLSAGQTTTLSSALEAEFDFAGLYSYLHSQLPAFQNPLFLRFQKEQDVTATFKHRKADLVLAGFDPTTIHDPLYFRDDQRKQYVRLDATLYQAIQTGKVRL